MVNRFLRHILVLFLLFSTFCLISCYGSWNPFDPDNDVDERIDELSDITEQMPDCVKNSSGEYSVLILTDLHYGAPKGSQPEEELFTWLEEQRLNNKLPRFAISLGDSADYGSQDQYDDYNDFCNKLEQKFNIPVINVPGNHDLYKSNWENWKKNCFPNKSFFMFKTDKISWYALDTASGSIGLKQYNMLKKEIESDPNPKIVFTHYPILEFKLVFGLCDTVERNLLIDLFVKNNVVCSLGGHLHYYSEDKLKDYNEYCLPAFLEKKSWSVLTVNENNVSINNDIIKMDVVYKD